MRSFFPVLISGGLGALYIGMLRYARLFSTDEGRFELGHPNILKGDEVWLVSGIRQPFAFRPHPGGVGHKVVGSLVVQGAMSGELWLENQSELEDLVII